MGSCGAADSGGHRGPRRDAGTRAHNAELRNISCRLRRKRRGIRAFGTCSRRVRLAASRSRGSPDLDDRGSQPVRDDAPRPFRDGYPRQHHRRSTRGRGQRPLEDSASRTRSEQVDRIGSCDRGVRDCSLGLHSGGGSHQYAGIHIAGSARGPLETRRVGRNHRRGFLRARLERQIPQPAQTRQRESSMAPPRSMAPPTRSTSTCPQLFGSQVA